ncbi:MAG: tRNA 2-thiouridine(34) synthase MnmA [Chloroflexota bacterium]|nr:tRNA 2-thiouridine(34) synthase MnmA [Chloroflexota bacterium]MDE2968928.1 tRNA 2-thiouridine(34) synthase MnmA [Chloroflexota bacterium]
MPASPGRVVVAMSGGVDSSVAALLLARQGYEVIGVTLRLYAEERSDAAPLSRGCCTLEDIDDARRVCAAIGARHYVINAEREFRAAVIDHFLAEYERGRTPHPCIACNDMIKFSFLLDRALAMDADAIATGHYARARRDDDGTVRLLKAVDPAKDQSYVLFGLRQDQLRRLLLPVGDYAKPELRELAREAGLGVADKADSQDICFIPAGDYRQFLTLHREPVPGDIVDTDGAVLGAHQGVDRYTVGQRRGIGVASAEPLYVVRLEPEARRVVVGPESALYAPGLAAEGVNWVRGAPPDGPVDATVKIRYRAAESPAVVEPAERGANVWFAEPQRAVTPGQAAVFYAGDELLGGGFIAGPLTSSVRPELVEGERMDASSRPALTPA